MLRILVADDERTIRRGLAAMLQRDIKEDIELLEAGNGADALKLVRQRCSRQEINYKKHREHRQDTNYLVLFKITLTVICHNSLLT